MREKRDFFEKVPLVPLSRLDPSPEPHTPLLHDRGHMMELQIGTGLICDMTWVEVHMCVITHA